MNVAAKGQAEQNAGSAAAPAEEPAPKAGAAEDKKPELPPAPEVVNAEKPSKEVILLCYSFGRS